LSDVTPNDWVIVDNFIDVIHADIVRDRLEADGIPAILGNRHLVTAEWLYSQAMGGVQVMVPSEYVVEAREIIAEIDSGKLDCDDEDLKQIDSCLECGSELVRKTSGSWKFALFIGHFLWLPSPFRQNVFYCPQCKA
jgi:Putative prokaryotic signal transducing protein